MVMPSRAREGKLPAGSPKDEEGNFFSCVAEKSFHMSKETFSCLTHIFS